MEELNKANHKCKDCGTTENHMWNKSTKCTKCNKTCNHQFYESNGEVKCRDCNIKLDSCNKRRMQHTYVRYNLYGGEICVNCYAPNPANPPSYLQNNP